jgi:hypothetical protein
MVANKPIPGVVQLASRMVRFRKPDLQDWGGRLTSASD